MRIMLTKEGFLTLVSSAYLYCLQLWGFVHSSKQKDDLLNVRDHSFIK